MDWSKIKTEYVAGGISQKKLAEKHGIPFGTLRKVATKEKWTELRAKTVAKADLKISNSVSSKQAQNVIRIFEISSRLLGEIESYINKTEDIPIQVIASIIKALKNIKDVQGIKSDLDTREQEAKIRILEKSAEISIPEVKIIFGGTEDLAQ